jgi:hypothetical protein
MLIPAAMFIESAADSLPRLTDFVKTDQLKELASFGDVRAQRIGATGLSEDFKIGYTLGLQVARTLLAQNVTLLMAKINSSDLL